MIGRPVFHTPRDNALAGLIARAIPPGQLNFIIYEIQSIHQIRQRQHGRIW